MEDNTDDPSPVNKTKEDIIKEIVQLRKNIKQKHQTLKRDILQSEEMWENKLKPISEPLKILVEEGGYLQEDKIQQHPLKTERKRRRMVGVEEVTPAKRYIPNPIQGVKRKQKINYPLQPEYESDYEYGEENENQPNPKRLASHHSNMDVAEVVVGGNDAVDNSAMVTEPVIPVQFLQNEETYESPVTGEELIKTPQGKKLAKDFIHKNFKGKLARDYFLRLIQGGKTIDCNYGVRVENDSWMIGDKEIEIDDNDLIIDGVRYLGTPGLYELIFMNIPNEYIYSKEDLDAYAQILIATKAHRTNYSADGRIKSNRGIKYKSIISQITNRNTGLQANDMTTYTGLLHGGVSGSGILLTNSQPQYIYYDDPNELVDRLRTLLASQQAGNTAHADEINSIMEELNELKPVLFNQINNVTECNNE